MKPLALSIIALFIGSAAVAQSASQDPSPFYPSPPPEKAPVIQQGAPTQGLTSPLLANEQKITRTQIDSDAEAQLFAGAAKIAWGRHAKIKGAKTGTVAVTKQGALWTIKGRIDSEAPGTEGDWASIEGVVERIATNTITIRGEVAFRVAKVQKGTPCKVSGTLHLKRSGKSQIWRLVEGDNPCDGAQELLDVIYEKPAEKKPVPQSGAPAKRT